MTPCSPPPPPAGFDLRALCELVLYTQALRDHLEQQFQRSEGLCHAVTELTEQALGGDRPSPQLTLSRLHEQDQDLQRGQRLLTGAQERARVLSLQLGTRGEVPLAVPARQKEGLIGLLDGLSMLQVYEESAGSRPMFQDLVNAVERVLLTALHGAGLELALGLLEAERKRFVLYGEGASAGCVCLEEAIAALRRVG